jgi:hypothetical protein
VSYGERNPRIDIEQARRQGSLRGDPMIAPACSNYPEGKIIDYFCLACGRTFAGHDDDNDCWRVLKSEEELRRYDEAREICDRIKYGEPLTIEATQQTGIRGGLCAAEQDDGSRTSQAEESLSLCLRSGSV